MVLVDQIQVYNINQLQKNIYRHIVVKWNYGYFDLNLKFIIYQQSTYVYLLIIIL